MKNLLNQQAPKKILLEFPKHKNSNQSLLQSFNPFTGIQREEEKVKRTMKDAAKKGDVAVCKMLAKEIIQSRRAVTRIYTSKAHLNSVQCQMKAQMGKTF